MRETQARVDAFTRTLSVARERVVSRWLSKRSVGQTRGRSRQTLEMRCRDRSVLLQMRDQRRRFVVERGRADRRRRQLSKRETVEEGIAANVCFESKRVAAKV